MSWKKFDGSVTGTKVDGDPSVPATKWYNIWWLWLFGWKKVVVLKVDAELVLKPGGALMDPLYFGYQNIWGKAEVNDTPLTDITFLARRGREKCIFFVVDGDGKEVPLRVVTLTTKNDPLFKKFPLI
ncbi:hypothetical protein A2856_03390 [Candidatus Uhrbacteria bacterium RIFCSPHIGHO2_01_FULL_63_20]|uniref:Uncharacterized protein n=1 Tax=Candidatus Uhrbacteria bacterium RIFCSPHIGHO2_01_FULL_63_20 TaxID=1802385 RepID=A0A1F7TLA5_9BACT|nr:MAG: hypothetical protein A2856_03390 [Candidatus Uhrbacteria bacterium RIFCSPHIGHO2_01_FULL_63_20]